MASTTKLSSAGTKFVKFRGNVNIGTSSEFPTDDVDEGELYVNTSDNKIYTRVNSAWRASATLTTTSTSSTTTSTSTS